MSSKYGEVYKSVAYKKNVTITFKVLYIFSKSIHVLKVIKLCAIPALE